MRGYRIALCGAIFCRIVCSQVVRRCRAATLIALSWAASVGAAAPPTGAFKAGPYIFEAPHYRIATDVSLEKAQEIAKHMESIYREYSVRLSAFGGRVSTRYEIRVYRDRDSYLQDVGEKFRNSGGVYMSRRRMLATYKGRKPWGRVFAILYHEGFHQFFHHYIGKGPPWINEGLATLFEGAVWNGKGFDVGDVPPGRLFALQRAFRSGNYIHIRELATMDSTTWIRNLGPDCDDPGSLEYSFAWSFVHFLAYANRGRYKGNLDRYLWALRNRTDSVQAFLSAFGGNIGRIEKLWIGYVMKLKPTPRQVCRNNLLMLALIEKACAEALEEEQPSIEAFYHALMNKKWKGWWVQGPDGIRHTYEDVNAIAAWFRCPFDRSRRRPKISYRFERPSDSTELPTIVCLHHRGIIYRARLVKEEGNGRVRAWVDTEIRKKHKRRTWRR